MIPLGLLRTRITSGCVCTTKSLLSRGTLIRSYSSSNDNNNKNNNNVNVNLMRDKILTWDEFLRLRSKRRTAQLIWSVITGIGGSLICWGYVANIELDVTQTYFGLDMITWSIIGIGTAGLIASQAGPTVGNRWFLTLNRKIAPEFLQRENVFLAHIRKNRVDPSKNSVTNPVPDYYGEKISSLYDYRRWLRDCAAYRRKTKNFL